MIKIHEDVEQGSEAWKKMRTGVLTASEMKLVVTKTKKIADNDKIRAHLYELAAQRITGYTEPSYIGDDMLRGWEDEITAKEVYTEKYAPVEDIGFITNDKLGFKIGFSPDGRIVGKNAGIECKSRRQKFQVETIMKDAVPDEYIPQIQTGLFIAEWDYIDFISFSAGLPMFVKKVEPDLEWFDAIERGAKDFEEKLQDHIKAYKENVAKYDFAITERSDEEDII